MDKPENSEFSPDFARIQPLCAKLVRDCSLENMKELEEALNDVNSKFINTFKEYLLFPFRLSLMKIENENLLIKSLDIATSIFNRSELDSWPLFSNTVTTAFQRISDPQHIDKVSDTSEELKLSVCQCVSSMVENSTDKVRHCMYGGSFSLPLAHVFHTLIVLLQHERSKSLRRAILRTIGLFCYGREFIPSRDDKTESLASKSLAFYLPGLSMGLANVVCGDNKQGESVIRMALKILADLIVITVNDCCSIVNMSSDASISQSDQGKVFVIKNATWFKEVASKFQILLQNTTVLVTHDHWKVRQDYLGFAGSILQDCTRNLENCIPFLLPAVFALSVDSHEDISQQGQRLIQKFSDKFQGMNSFTLCSVIEDELYSSASKLIKCKLSANDDQKLFILRSVLGCLQILGSSVDKVLFSASHLEKLMLSLLNLLEFESSLLMVEEISVNLDISSMNIMPRKRFCYFEKREILDTIGNICCCLGKSKYNRLVIDYLIENMHTSEIFLLQSIFLIGCIVEGLSNDSANVEENIDLIGDIIQELLSPALFDVLLHRTDVRAIGYTEQSSVQVYNDNNIYQVCLILEAVEKCAKILGKTFRVFLNKVLFKIMEKAGSSNYIISQAGKICLYGIARFCDYNPRVELVRHNADYLISTIILNYHHFLYKPEMSSVLQVVLQESDGEMLPLFKDCINRLLKMLDCNQERALPILVILKSVVIFVKKWFPTEKPHDSGLSTPAVGEFSDLQVYFMQRNEKLKELLRDSSSEDSEAEEVGDKEDSSQEKEEKILLHVGLVSQVLKQCSHFQSSRNLQLRVLALEVMELSILALSDFEREQHPLVHQLWNSFVRRFSEENIIVLQAFKVLLVIAEECRDFVRARCIKDVVPKLAAMLKNNFSSSLLKNYIKSYQWSNECKLQLCVLSEIGGLFVKLDVTEKDIAQLVEVCLPYLQKSQPKVFREAAFKTLKALTVIDPDAIWFYFNCYYSNKQVLSPPHEHLQLVNFPLACATDSQFRIDC